MVPSARPDLPGGGPVTQTDTGRQVRLVLAAVFMVFVAQMVLNPIIAPLAREVGLQEWHIGVTISVGAMMLVLTSQWWGRRSQSWGRKPVLVAAFAVAACALTMFAVAAYLGMRGVVTGTVLFLTFVLLRGIGVGGAVAAVPPTAQAYIADITPDRDARVRGMAGVGAAQGLAMVVGALLGGVLSLFGLMVPLIAVPIILVAGLIVLATRLQREPATSLIRSPSRVRPTDQRILVYLVAGFGMFTALGFVLIVSGFLVQDRLDVAGSTAGFLTGMALLAAGIGLVITQSVVVPRTGWSPAMLMRIGSLVSVCGFVALIPDLGPASLYSAHLLIGAGLGLAMPGYTAGATMQMERHELGGAAGLVGATNGLTFAVAPTLGTVLYATAPVAPIILGAAMMSLVAVFVLVHPRFRAAAQAPATTRADGDGGDIVADPPLS